MKPIEYIEDPNASASYQYVPLSKIVEDFVYESTDDDSYLKNVRRVKIIKHVKDAIRELNKSTLNESKVFEVAVPETLYVDLPHDFVGLRRINRVVYDQTSESYRLHPLNVSRTMNNAPGYLQDAQGLLLFDEDGRILKDNGNNVYNKPYKKYEYASGADNKQISRFGEFSIDNRLNKINFSSDLALEHIVIEYRTDGLQFDTYGEDEIRVHKDMIEVVRDLTYYTLIRRRRNVPMNEKQSALNRFKTTRHEAKLKKLNLNLIEIFRKGRNANY